MSESLANCSVVFSKAEVVEKVVSKDVGHAASEQVVFHQTNCNSGTDPKDEDWLEVMMLTAL